MANPGPKEKCFAGPARGAKTLNEVMAKHQNTATCYGCHSRIDPLGLALDRYDPIGRLREEYRHIEVVSNADTRGTVKTSRSAPPSWPLQPTSHSGAIKLVHAL